MLHYPDTSRRPRIRYGYARNMLGIHIDRVSVYWATMGLETQLWIRICCRIGPAERGARRNQRAERGTLAGKTDLAARLREHVCPRRREKLLPPSLRLPLPSSPSTRGAAAGRLLFPRRLLWSSIEQDQICIRMREEQDQEGRRR